jgi:hypothetical protein
MVSLALSVHVLVGVLQPSWIATGRLAREDLALTALALVAVWAVAGVKVVWG